METTTTKSSRHLPFKSVNYDALMSDEVLHKMIPVRPDHSISVVFTAWKRYRGIKQVSATVEKGIEGYFRRHRGHSEYMSSRPTVKDFLEVPWDGVGWFNGSKARKHLQDFILFIHEGIEGSEELVTKDQFGELLYYLRKIYQNTQKIDDRLNDAIIDDDDSYDGGLS